MRFKKIQFDGKKVKLAFEEVGESSSLTHKLESDELPHPDFKLALDALQGPAASVCDMPAEYGAGFQPVGLTIDYPSKGGRGFVVTCRRTVEHANGPLNLATPRVREPEAEDGDIPELIATLIQRAEVLIQAADDYRTGTRAQGDMFAGGEG